MKDKGIKIKDTIKQHILNNKKEYILVSMIFVIGIFLGVLFVNNIQEAQKAEIQSYFSNFMNKMKETEKLEMQTLLNTSIFQNLIVAVIIWFFGTTVIRYSSSIWNSDV